MCGVCFTISPSLINQFLDVFLPDGFAAIYPAPDQLAVEFFGEQWILSL